MWEYSGPSTSKAKLPNSNRNNIDNQIESDEEYNQENETSLWSIDDDTMFFAQGLKHHSAGKGKSVFVCWNENYLLNFVFKCSEKKSVTTLTKVRISMPLYEEEFEEIANMLILEMNTLLYMKSGRVYYFSSVKSMHRVEWLTGVRCMTSCPQMQFSTIRVQYSGEDDQQIRRRILSLNVYKDVPQLGKYVNEDNILCHTYDISFDDENIFNCDWLDESYTLLSLITDEKNYEFLKDLVAITNILRPDEEKTELGNNQEVHIFSISGNIFVLVGAIVNESEMQSDNTQVKEYSVRLLNTYASNIECIRFNCDKNLLIVLLQSGHLDIWYKSSQIFGSIYHHYHQISNFLDYDYRPVGSTFYFTTNEDIIQLKIVTPEEADIETECLTKEIRKSISGMIACTWVESMQQLVCLSFNNIFYRIYFKTKESTECETKYENLNNLYALNTKRVEDLMCKATVMGKLIECPKRLHEAIEKEFEKQQILALGWKHDILKKLFHCHIEWHIYLPSPNYFDEDCIQIKTLSSSCETHSFFSLIFVSLKNNKKTFLKSLLNTSTWYFHISNLCQSLLLPIPNELFDKELCFVLQTPLKTSGNKNLTQFSLNILSFLNHNGNFLCLKFNLILECNEKTYQHIFSNKIQNTLVSRNFVNDVENLLASFNIIKSTPVDIDRNNVEIKHQFGISEKALRDIMSKYCAKLPFDRKFKLYYLYEYLIDLSYDDSKQILQISSRSPEAILYIKLLLMHAMQSSKDLQICSSISDHMLIKAMNYQTDIENLYGSLLNLESTGEKTNIPTMHLEKLTNVYLKLRSEFYNIFR
ncbi:hypothetical protein DOY81_000955 [Sarcophaga bullata]|nr:hypothetical protein DOY81_000955 [Sarcophaga bullata]